MTTECESLQQSVESNAGFSPELVDALQQTIERLEGESKRRKAETAEAVEKLSAHDTAAKRAITALQKEMGLRVEQVRIHYYQIR